MNALRNTGRRTPSIPEPRTITSKVRREIIERLRQVALAFPSTRQFAARLGTTSSTTSRWFARKPALPDGAALYRMAVNADVSVDWLLTGEGAPHRSHRSVDLSGLRSAIVQGLVQAGAPPLEAEAFVPSANQLLEEGIARYRERWLAWRESESLVQRARRLRGPNIADAIADHLAKRNEPR